MALSLIQPAGESDIQSDNCGIDGAGVSGDIDKCETEGLVSDGEDGCQRENRFRIDLQLYTSLGPLLLSFLSLAFLLFSLYCFHPVQFTPLLFANQKKSPKLETAECNRAETSRLEQDKAG